MAFSKHRPMCSTLRLKKPNQSDRSTPSSLNSCRRKLFEVLRSWTRTEKIDDDFEKKVALAKMLMDEDKWNVEKEERMGKMLWPSRMPSERSRNNKPYSR